MRAFLREPLLHFLLGGALLFWLYAEVAPPSATRPDRIIVREDQVEMLSQTFARTWMRPPTRGELEGLIEEFVDEEVLYREALALGLDRDDLIVRRRMRQKMDFLNEGLATRDASEEELGAFLAANPERFVDPSRTTLAQVFFSVSEGHEPTASIAAALAALQNGASAEELGDPTLLPRSVDRATPAELERTFGPAFATAVGTAPESEWHGPIASSFGLHLVQVRTREPERHPALDEVRPVVVREWESENRATEQKRFYERLRERYEVEVRIPAEAAGDEAP